MAPVSLRSVVYNKGSYSNTPEDENDPKYEQKQVQEEQAQFEYNEYYKYPYNSKNYSSGFNIFAGLGKRFWIKYISLLILCALIEIYLIKF